VRSSVSSKLASSLTASGSTASSSAMMRSGESSSVSVMT
jgi:hypothetical protein